ncbi:CPBP family intramembrane glutamic endopeptidase [Butyrivibrio fibrisolvens]|uniref:CPBP family intramembrane glutamic endopeptidase n=1 Tax=Butyrivibrio fibrisolvens TaxID=831 RepID=UPI0003B33385|nr:CPBP family intramembrane glutamic endopeptidase [Butyrivibrio fibrisolvens]
MKSALIDFFKKEDKTYIDQLKSYTIIDTIIAVALYVLIMIVYYYMGLINARTGEYYGEIVNISIIVITIILCLKDISRAGISSRNLIKSICISLVIGIIWLVSFSIIPNLKAGYSFLPLNIILDNAVYYFVIIAFTEEISFRGFIQPRLYPVLKKEWLVYLIGGLMFVSLHYPFQMAVRGMSFMEYLPFFLAGAPMQLVLHYVFTWLYRRYGNIFGATILHGCVDMTMGLFG